ncbi:hypothetical protein IEI94_01520 [Halomonas sp. ML-15]|uniref:hypothetical protein n=1 Tax=Halomonas sp. ML-15 TaxID=2773305 RepID=UPI001746E7F9|nr:hypothetical protein [Halomonas sp. ML-15]MBD3894535.1 hypothetical protein [Halomonas sp. ML-15]
MAGPQDAAQVDCTDSAPELASGLYWLSRPAAKAAFMPGIASIIGFSELLLRIALSLKGVVTVIQILKRGSYLSSHITLAKCIVVSNCFPLKFTPWDFQKNPFKA